MKALFTSRNLIGDALNIYPALKSWWNEHQDWEMDMLTLPDHVRGIYESMGMPIRTITEDHQKAEHYDFEFVFNTNLAFQIGDIHKTHIAVAFARMLGVARIADEDFRLYYEPKSQVQLEDYEKGLVVISPFSRSCSSQSGGPPNKMLRWETWKPLLRFLRTLGPIACVGAQGDRAMDLELLEDEYFTGLPLERVAQILKHAKLVVTIDNGIGHLAASQMSRMILFYPACLGTHWILPIGNKNLLKPVHLDPVTINAIDLTLAVKSILAAH